MEGLINPFLQVLLYIMFEGFESGLEKELMCLKGICAPGTMLMGQSYELRLCAHLSNTSARSWYFARRDGLWLAGQHSLVVRAAIPLPMV